MGLIASAANEFLRPHRRTVGLRDIPLAFFAPGRLFARVEDVNAYLWPLVVLLCGVTLLGYATIESGLIDRQVQEMIEKQKAEFEKLQVDVVEKPQLRKALEDLDKQGQFLRLMTRLQVVVMAPMGTLAAILLLGAVFYGLVALCGRKPEWNTLMTILTYAGFIDLLKGVVSLVLMLRYHTLNVDLTLGAITRPIHFGNAMADMAVGALGGLLAALDPFALWFWVVVILGLKTTGQLKGWLLWTSCLLMVFVGAGMRVMGALAMQMSTGGK